MRGGLKCEHLGPTVIYRHYYRVLTLLVSLCTNSPRYLSAPSTDMRAVLSRQ